MCARVYLNHGLLKQKRIDINKIWLLSKTSPRCFITLNHVVQTQLEFFLYSSTFLILQLALILLKLILLL